MKPVFRCLIGGALVSVLLLCGCAPQKVGQLSVLVLDGWTDAPVSEARVVVAETGEESITNAEGQTKPFTVPILHDQRFSKVLPQQWGAVTVLVYADGYYDCMMYAVRVNADTHRAALPVRLFPGDGTMGETPFLLVESPDSVWASELLRRFAQ